MLLTLRICDLCEGDYRQAVAEYIDMEGAEHDICEEHLKLVKESGMQYVMLLPDVDEKRFWEEMKQNREKEESL